MHFALLDPEGRIRWLSPGLERSRGSGLIGQDCHESLFRRESDCFDCRRQEVLATGKAHQCWIPERRPGRFGRRQMLVQMRTPSGQLLEVVIDAGPAESLFSDEIFRERVLAEGLRHVSAGVLLLDAAMRVVNANPAAVRLLGEGLERLRGRALGELLPEGCLPAGGERLAAILVSRGGLEVDEVRLDSGSGQALVRLSLAVVPAPGGVAEAAVAILTDITRERRVSLALQRKLGEISILREIDHVLSRTARLDQVLRVILAAVVHPRGLALARGALFLCEGDEKEVLRGRLVRSSPASGGGVGEGHLAQQLEDLAFAEPSGEDRRMELEIRDLAVPLGETADVLSSALESPASILVHGRGEGGAEMLCRLLGSDQVVLAPLVTQGRRLGVLAGAVAPGGPAPEDDLLTFAGVIAAAAAGAIERARLHDELARRLSDLHEAHTRLRHLQGQLLQAEHMSALGELAAEIVHQIRNPLAVVGGFARRLERNVGEDDPRREDVRILVEETARMEAILERVRQEVRVARGDPRETVLPEELLAAAMKRYEGLARAQGIDLEVSVENGLPRIRGGRDVLLEVLDNLLRNAFDAVSGGGTVRVEALRLRGAVHLVVEDDGPGLSAEQAEKIFEPFYTTKEQGTGLGLALSRRLVRQCGGSLSVDGRPGRGARFRIVLPLARAPVPAEEE
ncbi:MAG: PAS domain-containing sensor histidine kinase [Acidobacteriota bacterium]|nr:PAS domain-containing sensor histidine kinase [Acidobacteriota bacterium]